VEGRQAQRSPAHFSFSLIERGWNSHNSTREVNDMTKRRVPFWVIFAHYFIDSVAFAGILFICLPLILFSIRFFTPVAILLLPIQLTASVDATGEVIALKEDSISHGGEGVRNRTPKEYERIFFVRFKYKANGQTIVSHVFTTIPDIAVGQQLQLKYNKIFPAVSRISLPTRYPREHAYFSSTPGGPPFGVFYCLLVIGILIYYFSKTNIYRLLNRGIITIGKYAFNKDSDGLTELTVEYKVENKKYTVSENLGKNGTIKANVWNSGLAIAGPNIRAKYPNIFSESDGEGDLLPDGYCYVLYHPKKAERGRVLLEQDFRSTSHRLNGRAA
jgi:hypothetical protein